MGNRNGFTLVELLVASLLMSVVMAGVYTLFYSTIGTWKAVDSGYDMPRAARNLSSLVESDYSNVLYAAGHLFEGAGDTMTLFAVLYPMDVEKPEGRHLMRVRYTYNRSRKMVTREEALVDAALPAVPPPDVEIDDTRIQLKDEKEMVVAKNVRRFNLRYVWLPNVGTDFPDGPPPWTEPIFAPRHREKWGLPQGIELSLEMQDPEGKKPPYATRVLIPTRTESARMDIKGLEKLLSGVM
ncbi:MAG: prepilin-type N-terminal cleavage/methylation domain-containing protein [Candidatus Hydrogenedentes bacterium]|nr:prepilin-type N-terminal cleavage/methylation domain-containing protein [Candidatus Hydrogenedentota bacterium]